MKRTPGIIPAEHEAYWTKIIEEARRYPAGVTAYCTDKDIAKNNYYSWFKRLGKSHPEWQDFSDGAPPQVHCKRQSMHSARN